MQVASDICIKDIARINSLESWNPLLYIRYYCGSIYPEYEHTDPLGCQKIRDKIRFPKEKFMSMQLEQIKPWMDDRSLLSAPLTGDQISIYHEEFQFLAFCFIISILRRKRSR